MSAFRQLFEVAKRDFVQRARSKAFLMTTLLTVGVVLTLAPLIALEMRDPAATVVGLVGDTPAGLESAAMAAAGQADVELRFTRYADAATGEQALLGGKADVLVIGGDTLRWHERRSATIGAVLDSAIAATAVQRAVDELGLDPAAVSRLLTPPSITDQVADPPAPDQTARAIGAQAGTFVLYMSIIIFGQFILMGIMEEKQSRVVEVVLARIPPDRLLAGKILGIGALGLLQILALGGAIMAAASMVDLPDVRLPSLSAGILVNVVVWYLLGYALFATIYGAVGATVSRQEDAQGAAMLPTMLVVPGFAISIFAMESPGGLVPTIASFVPVTAPMVMPVRMALGATAWWEPLVAAALMIVSVYLLVKLAGRVYRGAVLSLGARVRLRDAWRASSP